MNSHVITALILVAALALYGVGLAAPAGLLLLLGFIFEIWFWVRVSKPSKKMES